MLCGAPYLQLLQLLPHFSHSWTVPLIRPAASAATSASSPRGSGRAPRASGDLGRCPARANQVIHRDSPHGFQTGHVRRSEPKRSAITWHLKGSDSVNCTDFHACPVCREWCLWLPGTRKISFSITAKIGSSLNLSIHSSSMC